ncbi:MAG: hypothetical protein FJ290_15030 [Planctomycetes bacterium]|nr:hypothetical protein [Planctomycetota bacterium]
MKPLGVLLFLLGCFAAAAQDAAELELDHEMSMEFETPHTKWARPYARGRLRVLMFCNGRGTTPREGVELKQRFDVDVDAVFWAQIVDSNKQGWHGGDLGVARMLRLAEKPYDAYVFLGIPPANLSSEMQFKVLKPVTDGAGIVLVGVADKRILKAERRLKELPPFLAPAGVAGAYQVGKGRGVELPKPPDIPYGVGWETEYDHWQERLGRAILWAAGKEPQIELRARIEAPQLDRDRLPQKAVGCSWRNPRRTELSIEISIRSRQGWWLPYWEVKSADAEGEVMNELPKLRADDYYLEIIARGGKGVEAWAAARFKIVSDHGVKSVELHTPWGEVSDTLRGTVSLQADLGNKEWVEVRLCDRRNRILMRRRLAAGQLAFEFPVEPWFPMLVRVEAVRCYGGGETASAHAWFNVVKRHRGQFNFLIWDVPTGSLAPYAEESLARLGMTLQLKGGTPPPIVAAHDTAWVPYTTRIQETHDKDGVMKPFCWNDEAKVTAHVNALAEKYREARQHGVFVYSLGDENDVRGSCTSPHCLRAYRQYLAKEYGSIEALNASWGSAYKSFDEVELLKPDDNTEAEAKRQKNYPRWFDREAFRSWNYVQFCKKFAAAYRAIDPQSRTGFEGAGRFAAGDDLDLFVRELEFWSPYPGTADEVLRSIAPRDFPRANWMGYTKDAPSLLSKYWRMVTRGCDSVWWWRWDCIGRFHGWLAPHLGPWPATKEIIADTQIVRDGLGDLLLHSERQDDGIAILFSHPSCYAAQLDGSYDGVEQNHVAWHRAIRDLGLNFSYVTDRQLRLGEFDAKRFKVLILSRAEAIGPKEAEVIRQFAEGGGAVIADVRPGIYDGHCKPLAEGCLDKLFGIRRTGRGPAVKGKAEVKIEGFEFSFDAAYDPSIEPATRVDLGGRCGETPLMIAHKGKEVGKGQVVLMNLPMVSYPAFYKADGNEAAAGLLAELFRIVGAKPGVVAKTKGQRTHDLETVRWRNGDLEIVALWRERGEDEDVQVELAEPRFVYDLRNRKALGQQKTFATRLLASRASFFVLSPRELPRAKASLARAEVAPGEQARLRLEVPDAAGLHALRLRASTPGGKPAEWLAQVILVGKEPKDVTLPIAFNDPPGKWEIRLIDLFTDQAESVPLAVKEATR